MSEEQSESDGLVVLLIKASARWGGSVLAYAFLGVLLSWLSFLPIAPSVWQHLPAMPAARAGGIGAVLVLVVWGAHPAGLLTLLYLVGFPAGFVLLGHQQGLRAAIRRLVRGRTDSVARWILNLAWPSIERVAGSTTTATASGISRAVLDAAEQKGIARRALRLLLRRVRLSDLVLATGFLESVEKTPEAARRSVETELAERLEALVETHRVRTFLLAAALPIGLSASSSLWLQWLFGSSNGW